MMFFTLTKFRFVILLIVGVCFLNSCKKKEESSTVFNNSTIILSETYGGKGMRLVITGGPFSPNINENTVTFNGMPATITSATSTTLKLEVPWSTTGPVRVSVNGISAPNQPLYTFVEMSCDDLDKLTYSNFQITNTTEDYIYYELDITNTGTNDIDLYSTIIQNYVSDDNTFNVGEDDPAGGSILYAPNTDYQYILSSNETIHVSHYAVKTGNYLIVILKGYEGHYVDCDGQEKYIITQVQ